MGKVKGWHWAVIATFSQCHPPAHSLGQRLKAKMDAFVNSERNQLGQAWPKHQADRYRVEALCTLGSTTGEHMNWILLWPVPGPHLESTQVQSGSHILLTIRHIWDYLKIGSPSATVWKCFKCLTHRFLSWKLHPWYGGWGDGTFGIQWELISF